MRWPDNPAAGSASAELESPLGKRRSARLKEDFFDSYVRWREASAEVDLAYQRWDSADRQDRDLAYAAFCAALDREGHAASVHADCADAVRAYTGDLAWIHRVAVVVCPNELFK
jgi:hypothetical protein